jgi:predicted GIY-YIG superfamily endonuclease
LKAKRHRHHVYVVELDKAMVYEPRFRRANPNMDPTQPCVYVGMTGLSPQKRLEKHKAGVKANRFVERYGLRLLPQLYAVYNPMPYDAAREMEVDLAISLREQGYGVWQA